MSAFHLILKPGFSIGFCPVLAVSIEKMYISQAEICAAAHYCPKQFQKQWDIQLHDVRVSSVLCSFYFSPISYLCRLGVRAFASGAGRPPSPLASVASPILKTKQNKTTPLIF